MSALICFLQKLTILFICQTVIYSFFFFRNSKGSFVLRRQIPTQTHKERSVHAVSLKNKHGGHSSGDKTQPGRTTAAFFFLFGGATITQDNNPWRHLDHFGSNWIVGRIEKWRSDHDYFSREDEEHCCNRMMDVLLYACKQNWLHCCFLAIRDGGLRTCSVVGPAPGGSISWNHSLLAKQFSSSIRWNAGGDGRGGRLHLQDA